MSDKNTKNILISADIFPPESGGPATYVVSFANELVSRGIKVEIVSLNKYSNSSLVGCSLFKIKYKNKILRYLEYFFIILYRSFKADVIYAMGPVNAGFPSLLVSFLTRKKFVVKVVGDYAWEQSQVRFNVEDLIDEFQDKKDYVFFVRFLKWIESFVVKYADKVIVPSEYLKKIVLGWGAKDRQIEVVYNSVDNKKVDYISHNNEKWIVSVGRLTPWKGMKVLVEIMSKLLKDFPNLKLKIIGDGPESEEIKNNIKKFNLNNSVEMLGNLPKEKTLSFISSADLFILNSAYEGFSHVLLEALSFEKFILASNVGGNPELIVEGQTGSLFDYDNKQDIENKIRKYLKEGLVVNKEKIKEINFKFKKEVMNEKTINILEKICVN